MRLIFSTASPDDITPDDWRDLRSRLEAEPDLGRIEELRRPVARGELGADLYGLAIELGVVTVAVLGVALESWLRSRTGRFTVTWESDEPNGRNTITVEADNTHGVRAARAVVEDLTRALEGFRSPDAPTPTEPPPSPPSAPADPSDRPDDPDSSDTEPSRHGDTDR
ncbi:hypothetical protein [Streptomyces sp. NPDC048057]|uniref:effector-associated constant component EACC1 n=1 Tax=Streptomyces sp. NPDC048057 TaxID=3155628 RepID=UPI0033D876B1